MREGFDVPSESQVPAVDQSVGPSALRELVQTEDVLTAAEASAVRSALDELTAMAAAQRAGMSGRAYRVRMGRATEKLRLLAEERGMTGDGPISACTKHPSRT
jgi:DNA-directed RNA polymerase specialized sigma24 family protein